MDPPNLGVAPLAPVLSLRRLAPLETKPKESAVADRGNVRERAKETDAGEQSTEEKGHADEADGGRRLLHEACGKLFGETAEFLATLRLHLLQTGRSQARRAAADLARGLEADTQLLLESWQRAAGGRTPPLRATLDLRSTTDDELARRARHYLARLAAYHDLWRRLAPGPAHELLPRLERVQGRVLGFLARLAPPRPHTL